MKTELIDQLTKTQEELKQALHAHGIHRIFEQKGKIVVQESDEVQVKVVYQDGRHVVKPKFPQIGNTFQIVTTIALLAIFILLSLPFSFFAAIVLGQIVAFAFYSPKINKLKAKVEDAIR